MKQKYNTLRTCSRAPKARSTLATPTTWIAALVNTTIVMPTHKFTPKMAVTLVWWGNRTRSLYWQYCEAQTAVMKSCGDPHLLDR